MSPDIPTNEAARLAAIQRYGINAQIPQQAYEDLTKLASFICDTPIALVSLVESEYQWFLSALGLDMDQTPRDISFCAHAILEPNDLFIIPDATCDSRFADNPLVTGENGIRFYAGAPLTTEQGEGIGSICVLDRVPRELRPEQQEALRVLARQTMAQFELQRSLHELSRTIAERERVEAALRESEQRFAAFMDNSPTVAFIKDDQGRMVYVNQPFLKRFDLRAADILGKNDAELWPEEFASQYREHDRSVLSQSEPISMIEVTPGLDGERQYWQSYKFPIEIGRNVFLGGIALDITDNKRYEHELEAYQQELERGVAMLSLENTTDALTGIANRRGFQQRLESECNSCYHTRRPLSLLMIDIDKFKQFNDAFGHPAGDGVLQAIAQLLQNNARATDWVTRYGGEEFAVILPATSLEAANMIAERFRQAAETAPWPKRSITLSIGVATLAEGMDNMALLEAADSALYRAKQRGRNCVELAASVCV